MSLVIITTIAVKVNIVTPFQLYFNVDAIMYRGQVWRFVTTFLYFGELGVDLALHVYLLSRYARMLEEGSFRGRTADYVWFYIFGAIYMLAVAPFFQVMFLGQSLDMMIMYVWGRRNSQSHMRLFGILPFRAPYLPWVFLGISSLLGSRSMSSFLVDLLGIFAGHTYWFFEDVYPLSNNGRRPLKAPWLVRRLVDGPEESAEGETEYEEPQEGAPGGFDWGNNNAEEVQARG